MIETITPQEMIYAGAFMVFVILYLIYILFSKDAQYQRNIRSIASVVEDLNRELFEIKKEIKKTEKTLMLNTNRMSDKDIYAEIERTVYDMVKPLSVEMKTMQNTVLAIDDRVDLRVSSLESGVKQMSLPSSVHGDDDEKIIALFKQGVALDSISKELRISKAEVEFVLKINKIR